MTPPVIVRFEIEGMKHHILHAFQNYNRDIESRAEVILDRVIKEFDWGLEIEKLVYISLQSILQAEVQRQVRKLIAEGSDSIENIVKSAVIKQLLGVDNVK